MLVRGVGPGNPPYPQKKRLLFALPSHPPSKLMAGPAVPQFEFLVSTPKSGRYCAREGHGSTNRFEVTHDGREQLADRWMNVHRVLHHRVRGFGVHQIEDHVNSLVASGTEQ